MGLAFGGGDFLEVSVDSERPSSALRSYEERKAKDGVRGCQGWG